MKIPKWLEVSGFIVGLLSGIAGLFALLSDPEPSLACKKAASNPNHWMYLDVDYFTDIASSLNGMTFEKMSDNQVFEVVHALGVKQNHIKDVYDDMIENSCNIGAYKQVCEPVNNWMTLYSEATEVIPEDYLYNRKTREYYSLNPIKSGAMTMMDRLDSMCGWF
jgi:hypothetical protein